MKPFTRNRNRNRTGTGTLHVLSAESGSDVKPTSNYTCVFTPVKNHILVTFVIELLRKNPI
jgi:hypothetical protein